LHAALVREVRLVASHHCRLNGRTEAESRAVFGDQAVPDRHQWRVRVVVAGEIDRETGFVADLSALDSRLGQLVGDWRAT
jgi:6-pyruvoyl-tetrahydropterin synthase